MLLNLIEQRKPDYLAMVIDRAGEEDFRLKIFPEYKANRSAPPDDFKPQEERILQIVKDAGVPIFAGTDAGGVLPHGGIADEVAELASYGMPSDYVLGAASWRAREWLGWNADLGEGAPADFVVYPRDPREDLSVLREPTVVVLRGQPRRRA